MAGERRTTILTHPQRGESGDADYGGPLTREAFAPFGQVLMAVGTMLSDRNLPPRSGITAQATLNMAFLLSKASDPPWYIAPWNAIHTRRRALFPSKEPVSRRGLPVGA